MMYATPGGTVYPSEINPGPQGTAFGYASKSLKEPMETTVRLRHQTW
jgi:S-adenosylmethionine synthetase